MLVGAHFNCVLFFYCTLQHINLTQLLRKRQKYLWLQDYSVSFYKIKQHSLNIGTIRYACKYIEKKRLFWADSFLFLNIISIHKYTLLQRFFNLFRAVQKVKKKLVWCEFSTLGNRNEAQVRTTVYAGAVWIQFETSSPGTIQSRTCGSAWWKTSFVLAKYGRFFLYFLA